MSIKPTSSYSSNYERMSGNCTRIIASQMVASINPPITHYSYILDNACGPGIVSEQIKLVHPEAAIMATDLSPAMIEETKALIKTENWSNMATDTLDVRDLSNIKDNTFSHVFTNLGLPVPGDPDSGPKVAKEIYRVLQRNGVAMVSTWADRVWLTAFYNAASSVRPNEPLQTLMVLKPEELRASWLAAQLEAGGFGNNIEIRPSMTYTAAASLDELVENMMLAKQMFFAGYSEEELVEARSAFRKELQKLRTYEEVEGGGVRIGMKAWIGIGWKRGDGNEVPV